MVYGGAPNSSAQGVAATDLYVSRFFSSGQTPDKAMIMINTLTTLIELNNINKNNNSPNKRKLAGFSFSKQNPNLIHSSPSYPKHGQRQRQQQWVRPVRSCCAGE